MNQEPIKEFQGEYRFLSNFYVCNNLCINGKNYSTVEHYYQSKKCKFVEEEELIRTCTSPSQAKKLGKTVIIRDDWGNVKKYIMYAGVLEKFKQNRYLLDKLRATGDAQLIEGNWWGDEYWGFSFKSNRGANWLGKILMYVRDKLK
jgi:hypothetical protein